MAIVRFEMPNAVFVVAVKPVLSSAFTPKKNTRSPVVADDELPSIVIVDPAPVIVNPRVWVMTGNMPLLSVIVPDSPVWKLIAVAAEEAEYELASMIACRSDPAPLSARLVTVKNCAEAGAVARATTATAASQRRRRVIMRPRGRWGVLPTIP